MQMSDDEDEDEDEILIEIEVRRFLHGLMLNVYK